jgi:hypothetical protein
MRRHGFFAVLANALERPHGAADNLRRQAHEAQRLIEFLPSGEAPSDKLLEGCKLLCVVVLLV